MHPTDPADPDPLLRNAPGAEEDDGPAPPDPQRFTVHSEWSMVRVSKKRWFGR